MKKSLAIAYIAVFILLFIAPTIVFDLFGAYIDQTNYEQRNSAEKPAFTLETIEEFPQKYEEYFDDNLPFRTQLIEMNGLVDYYMFKQSSVSKVIIGSGQWLFYNPAGSDGDSIADLRGENMYTEEELALAANRLLAARDTLREQGKEFILYIAPNKETIYGHDYLPADYVNGNTYTRADQLVDYLKANTDLVIVYPKESLLNAAREDLDRLYYYKTDTHWNALGAYIGANELMKATGIQMPALEDLEITAGGLFAGDLAKMLGLSKYLANDTPYSLSGYSGGRVANVEYPLEGDTDLGLYSTEGADTRSLMVIRDSFASAMMPYLSTQYNNCCFVHRRIFTPEMLAQYPSDIVVLEIVERQIDYIFGFTVE